MQLNGSQIFVEVLCEQGVDTIFGYGGIVQGMSGSPILQNGRLVGAVTHVLVNDPTRGYGIFAQTMLEQAEQVATAEK